MRKTKFVLAILLVVFFVACNPVVVEDVETPTSTETTTPTETNISPTNTPTITPTNTSTPTKEPTPTADRDACLLIKGQLVNQSLYVGNMSEQMQLTIYLPPCYDEQSEREFPILYIIHGKGYDNSQWLDLGLIDEANGLISAGQIPPFIIVMPFDFEEYFPNEDQFDEDLIEEVIPYIEEEYRVLEGRENRVLGGLSRGANWAMYIGLHYPEMFSALGMHSLAISVSYEEGEVNGWLDEIAPEDMPRIYIDHGDKEFDQLKNSMAELMTELDERGFEYEFNEFVGEHDDAYWASNVGRYLLFYTGEWE